MSRSMKSNRNGIVMMKMTITKIMMMRMVMPVSMNDDQNK